MQERDRKNTSGRIFWVPVLAVAAIALYVHFQKPPNPFHAVQSVLNVTPDELESRCGTPSQDTSGVVVPGDGIRDFYYNAGGNGEVVFRFISVNDGQTWQSLGGWIRVDEAGDLGNPIDATETARRLSCVDKEDEAALTHHNRQLQVANTLAGTDLASSLGSLLLLEAPFLPNAYPDPESGTPRYTSARNSVQTALPCPPEAGGCETVQYTEFETQMNQAIQAEHDNDFEGAARVFTGRGDVFVQPPASEGDRTAAIQDVFKLEVKLLYLVEATLRDDLGKLTVFSADSPASQAQKVAVVVQADQARRRLWKQGVEANRPSYSSGSTIHFDSVAFQQLVQIHLTGNWPN